MATTSKSIVPSSKLNVSGCEHREPGSEGEPAAKRHRGCIKYYLQGPNSTIVQDERPLAAADSGSLESEQSECLPARTPAPPLVAAGFARSVLPTAATGRAMGTTLLQSLQRRFVTQSQLETPMLSERGSDEDEELKGFVLYSQPTYERLHSQRTADDADGLGSDSQALADTQFDGGGLLCRAFSNPAPRASAPGGEAEEVGSQQPAPAAMGRVSSGGGLELAAAHKLTPAVHSVDRLQLNNAPASLFPIFRSRRDCKTVYIVRHGESEYNAACAAAGSGWADPQIYDAPLTERGRQQAVALRAAIVGWELPADALWVTSPLTRAIQTMLLSCPDGRVPRGAGAVRVLPDISEKVFTSGDVGHPAPTLRERFPELAPGMAELPEVWWFTHPDKLNCAVARSFQAHEPKASVDRRVKAFRQWVLARPEKVIVAYGHSSYWKAFATACNSGIRAESLPNCGFMKLHI